jgi:hypothetical protein
MQKKEEADQHEHGQQNTRVHTHTPRNTHEGFCVCITSDFDCQMSPTMPTKPLDGFK